MWNYSQVQYYDMCIGVHFNDKVRFKRVPNSMVSPEIYLCQLNIL